MWISLKNLKGGLTFDVQGHRSKFVISEEDVDKMFGATATDGFFYWKLYL